jgi:hypothetical protein
VHARGVVVRTLVRHLLDLYERLAELEAAIVEGMRQEWEHSGELRRPT